MGTNFYTRKSEINSDDPEFHIGKRSAAGLYCWDCRLTLCKGGENAIHEGRSEWLSACPKCGKKLRKDEGLEGSSAGRELGFNNGPYQPKTGVASCSSFSWAMPESEWRKRCRVVWDEYGRKFSKAEFEQMLQECPVRFTRNIGVWFS